MELAELEKLLQQASASSEGLPAMQDQLARANALRDTPEPIAAKGAGGYVNPLQHVLQAMDKDRGRKESEAALANIGQAQRGITDAGMAEKMYGYGRDEQKSSALERWKLKEFQQKEAAAKALADAKAKERTLTDRNLPEGGVANIEQDKSGNLYRNGKLIENPDLYTEAAQKTAAINNAGGYGDKSAVEKQFQEFKNLNTAKDLYTKGINLSDEDKSKLNSVDERFKRIVKKGLTPKAFNSLLGSEFQGDSEGIKSFIQQISRMSAEERHALFGGSLTKIENESNQDFATRAEGLSLTDMMRRLKDNFTTGHANLISRDQFNRSNKYKNLLSEQDYSIFEQPLDVPPPATPNVPLTREQMNSMSTDELRKLSAGATQQ